MPDAATAAVDDSAAVRDRYDRASRLYDIKLWPMEALMFNRFRARLMSHVRGPRILEIGVGTGRNLTGYRSDVRVEGIDLSPGMLQRARRRRYTADIALREMNVEHLTYPPETFDTAVSTCVFCSVADPVRGLREIRRVLKRDGQALFLEHVRPGNPWLAAMFDRLDPFVSRFGPHINRRTVANIRAAGFTIEQEHDLVVDIVKLLIARP
jgi:ubiquinone/menaquinone biosynthesis C-methylase UbiE